MPRTTTPRWAVLTDKSFALIIRVLAALLLSLALFSCKDEIVEAPEAVLFTDTIDWQ